MAPNSFTVLVIIGGVALLIGLFGGGVEVSQIKFPKLDKWQRVFAGLVGALLIGLGLVLDPSVRNPMSGSVVEVTPTVELVPVALSITTSDPGPSTKPEVADTHSLDSPSSDTSLVEPHTAPLDTPTATNTSPPATIAIITPTVVTLTPSIDPLPAEEELIHDTPVLSPTTSTAIFTPESKPVDTPLPSPAMLAATSTSDEDWHRGLNYAPDKGLGCNDLVGVNYQPPGCADPLIDGQNEYVSILLLAGAKTGLDQQKIDVLWQQITAMAPKVFKRGYQVDSNLPQAYLVYDPIGAYANDNRWDIVGVEYGAARGRFYIIPPGQYNGTIPDGMEAIRVY